MPIAIAPPQTEIEIISQACSLVGKATFNTISAGGPFARDASIFLGTLVSAELGSNRWRFALKNEEMAILTTLDPAFQGWLYYWEMPADLIMMVTVDPQNDYTVFGRRVLTRSNSRMSAIYSHNVPVSYWPPPFSLYIVYALANMLAASVTNSDRMVARIQKDMKTWESRALFADGQNSPIRSMRSRPWINVRSAFLTRSGGR